MASGKRYYVQSPFRFRKAGALGRRHRRELGAPRGRRRRSLLLPRLPGRLGQPPHGHVPDEHGQPLRRRPGDRVVGDLRAGEREPRPAGLRRPARGLLPARGGAPTGATGSCPPTTRGPRCGPRARRSSTCTRRRGDPRTPAGQPRPARRPEPAAPRRRTPAATTWPRGWPATSWRSGCRCRCPASSTSTQEDAQDARPVRRRRRADRRVRPQVPARPPPGRAGRPVRPALCRHVGLARLHRTRPRPT